MIINQLSFQSDTNASQSECLMELEWNNGVVEIHDQKTSPPNKVDKNIEVVRSPVQMIHNVSTSSTVSTSSVSTKSSSTKSHVQLNKKERHDNTEIAQLCPVETNQQPSNSNSTHSSTILTEEQKQSASLTSHNILVTKSNTSKSSNHSSSSSSDSNANDTDHQSTSNNTNTVKDSFFYFFRRNLSSDQCNAMESLYHNAIDAPCQTLTRCENSLAEKINYFNCNRHHERSNSTIIPDDPFNRNIVGPRSCEYCNSEVTTQCNPNTCERPRLYLQRRRPPFNDEKYSKNHSPLFQTKRSMESNDILSNSIHNLAPNSPVSNLSSQKPQSLFYAYTPEPKYPPRDSHPKDDELFLRTRDRRNSYAGSPMSNGSPSYEKTTKSSDKVRRSQSMDSVLSSNTPTDENASNGTSKFGFKNLKEKLERRSSEVFGNILDVLNINSS